jgi:hypothetical protein
MTRKFETKAVYDSEWQRGPMQHSTIFGEHFVYSKQNETKKIMAFEKQLNDQSSLAKEIEEVKKQMYLKNDYILQVLDYSVEVQKSLCST